MAADGGSGAPPSALPCEMACRKAIWQLLQTLVFQGEAIDANVQSVQHLLALVEALQRRLQRLEAEES